ncbi:serine/threonine-protein kinase [Kribbella albertanoniae]|uniref:non-specific serine/threonine protein kinase n=1 Tax=Kribbella albertanoniae TaxID=1266829 RepID=A0A4R4Q9X1_9ACTN|nr:serine/threonine-protein kinase [Kribbella albertanoniae]TDC32098.1 serine/threonine protein kinase [Kribbella albertanoniae]
MEPGSLVAGRYRLEEELGQGGMGAVWRAVDQELGREVSLKRAIAGSSGQIRREARVGAGVLHPNVVAVFDTVVDADQQWLVTEYVQATSLDRIIEADGPLPEARVLTIGAQLATALVAIHERGIVHRDIKPANVLVTDDDVVKLTDLGIARWTEITQTGGAQLTGTLGYVAPEVANGSEATAASDVFSLGATLYAAVEGRSPWGDGADGPFSQIQRAAKGSPIPHEHARQLAPLLDALMEPDPVHRPSAAEAAELIQGRELPRRSWKRRLRPVRRGSVLTAVAAVLVVGAVLLAWLLPRGSEPQAAPPNPVGLGSDPAAADPCAVIPADALREFGEAFVDPEVRNYASCVISSTLEDGSGQVQSALEFTGLEEYPSRPVVPGQLGEIERPDEKENSCERAVTLPDTNRITITTFRIREAKEASLCPFAESLMQDVLAVLSKGPPPRRPELPANSLDKVDACTLVDAAEAGQVLGKASDPPAPDFGHWGCTWDAGPSELSAKFTREWPIEGDEEWGGKVIKIGNRNARLIPDPENKASCTAVVVHRLYTPRLAVLKGTPDKRQEVVSVELVDTSAPDSATVCARTRAAAEAVVRRLPDAS